MTRQQDANPPVFFSAVWNEELSRDRRYREATQKRSTEKNVRKEIEKLKQRLQVGRLRIEP